MWVPTGDTVAEERFAELYERHLPAVQRYVRSRIRDPHLAEDTVQETFVRVYRFLDRLDPDRPAWPWIKAIAAGMCSNAVRGRRHQAEVLFDDVAPVIDLRTTSSASTLPEEHCLRVEERSRVAGVLGRLPQRHRTVLVLKEVDQLSCAEIASLEGSSSETVKAVLARARAAFRRVHAAPAVVALRRRLRGRMADVQVAGVVQITLCDRLVPGIGALVLAASTWGGSQVAAAVHIAATEAPPSLAPMPPPPPPANCADLWSSCNQRSAQFDPARPAVAVAVAPTASTAASAVVTKDVDPEGSMTLEGELLARLGTEEPSMGVDVDAECDGEVRQHVCRAVAPAP